MVKKSLSKSLDKSSNKQSVKNQKHVSGSKIQSKSSRNLNKVDKGIDYGRTNEDAIMDNYQFTSERIPISVTIIKKGGEFVPTYSLQISVISKTTELILEKVRLELIRRVSLGVEDIGDVKKTDLVEDKFNQLIDILIDKYFPDSNPETVNFLRSYLKINSLGLGNLELLMHDENLEELVVNQAAEPAWVYHKKYGWLKTNVFLKNEEQTKHYASIIGRKVGRQISVLSPLLDAHLGSGDRVNATLSPVSTNGNTITIRKFSKDPWTITKFLKTRTISPEAAALIWTAIQYELSAIIAGGTASGKTSALNVFANFFPPNQRILSIEDTREIVLPKFLHWVPLNTTLPNAEGRGEINMGDLLVNSLRMRPDRILVGEVRRKRETETLFEAIHTGHSVYATFHANSAKETVERLTNSPLDVPKIMLPAISLIVVQFRNRRSGKRRTFQIAEIMPNGEANVIMQYDIKKDVLLKIGKSQALFDNISLFTGMTDAEINKELNDKVKVLNYLAKKDIDDVDGVGRIVAEYYTDKDNLMKYVNTDKNFPLASQLQLEESQISDIPLTESAPVKDEPAIDMINTALDDKSDPERGNRSKIGHDVERNETKPDAGKEKNDVKINSKNLTKNFDDLKDGKKHLEKSSLSESNSNHKEHIKKSESQAESTENKPVHESGAQVDKHSKNHETHNNLSSFINNFPLLHMKKKSDVKETDEKNNKHKK